VLVPDARLARDQAAEVESGASGRLVVALPALEPVEGDRQHIVSVSVAKADVDLLGPEVVVADAPLARVLVEVAVLRVDGRTGSALSVVVADPQIAGTRAEIEPARRPRDAGIRDEDLECRRL